MTRSKSPAHARGFIVEAYAARYLQQQGLVLLERNFCTPRGEIDLIMRDQYTLVFVEVRFRQNARFGSALESITPTKQQRLIRAAHIYLQSKPLSCPCRFDVLALTGPRHARHIDWIRQAFDAY